MKLLIPVKHIDCFSLKVAPLHQNRLGPSGGNSARGLLHGVEVVNGRAGEKSCLLEIGSDQEGEGNQFFQKNFTRCFRDQGPSVFADHYGIHYQWKSETAGPSGQGKPRDQNVLSRRPAG